MKIVLGTMTFAGQVGKPDAEEMLSVFSATGNTELDTAYQYQQGKTETLLGETGVCGKNSEFLLATKVNPWDGDGLKPAEMRKQFTTSLKRLQADSVDMLYLHAPDASTPIEESLEVVWEFHQQGRFKRFGLSNFSAWQVAEVVEICRRNNAVIPVVYQGLYNALNRDVEAELLPCLRHYGLQFYAYNPLAGGLLSGKHKDFEREPESGRFNDNEAYQSRYWKYDYFEALDDFVSNCEKHDIEAADAALCWMHHHSGLCAAAGDGVIVGVSQIAHLKNNIAAVSNPELPQAVLDSLDRGWDLVKADCFKYFRT